VQEDGRGPMMSQYVTQLFCLFRSLLHTRNKDLVQSEGAPHKLKPHSYPLAPLTPSDHSSHLLPPLKPSMTPLPYSTTPEPPPPVACTAYDTSYEIPPVILCLLDGSVSAIIITHTANLLIQFSTNDVLHLKFYWILRPHSFLGTIGCTATIC